MNAHSDAPSSCPDIPALLYAVVSSNIDSELAGHVRACTRCRELVRIMREQEEALPAADHITDCDEVEVVLGEIDEGLCDPWQLAPVIHHMRQCSLCYQQVAPAGAGAPRPRPSLRSVPAEPFVLRGDDRFEVKKKLGAGGMGVVYEAYDRKNKVTVALKTLRALSPHALYRLKNEFRERQDLQHPNLVNLGELIEHGGQWFFTMELVNGVDLLHYVRAASHEPGVRDDTVQWQTAETMDEPTASGRHRWAEEPPTPVMQIVPPVDSGAGFDEPRLRSALAQLCAALRALHDAGKVHRDVKPGNTLVTEDGRLVLLDFGLITSIEPELAQHDTAGTPAYMAPEQAMGKPVGPAADLYSVGALLYQALTGQRPFPDNHLELFLTRSQRAPSRPREVVPAVPADLDELCMELLAPEAEARPAVADVLARLPATGVASTTWETTTTQSGASSLHLCVGRDDELAALQEAYTGVRTGEAATVLIHGEPGIGKTTMVQRFRVWLRESFSGAMVLAGRCYERESVPYKAFDKVIDSLGRHLSRLDPAEVTRLMPADAPVLGQAFPVLARIAGSGRHATDADELAPQELRNRMFRALRSILANLADQVPLVISIDDLHWADADSLALLEAILQPPGAPRMLLLATLRDSTDTPVRELARALPGSVQRLQLGRLERAASVELTERLLTQHEADLSSAAALAREARGHPLFIHELVRGIALGETTGARFERALWSRIDTLEGPARRLLDMTVVAAAPMPQSILGRAAGLDPSVLGRHADDLRAANLVRAASRPGWLEPYHERVSKAVLGRLDAQARRSCHERLAWTLEAAGVEEQNDKPHPEALAVHWRGAGDQARARRYAIKAASQAARALAFDQAARLYRMAVELTPATSPDRHQLLAGLGRALASAGQGSEAAEAFAEAASASAGATALTYRLRAAQSLFAAGDIDPGLAALEPVVDSLGLIPARRPSRLGRAAQRARIDLRGLAPRTPPGDIHPDRLVELDMSRATCLALAMTDPARAADCLARHLVQALDTGEPRRAARALTLEAAHQALRGKSARRAAAARRQLQALADSPADAAATEARALAQAVDGLVALCRGQWRAARDCGVEAEALLRAAKLDFELGMTRIYLVRALLYLGRYSELSRLVPRLMRQAREHGHHGWYLEAHFRAGLASMTWLAADDPFTARKARARVARTWSSSDAFSIHQVEDLLARHHIALYTREHRAAWRDIEDTWPALERSGFLDYQLLRVECLDARARSALAAAPSSTHPLVRVCARDADRLAAESLPHARALAALIRAGLAVIDGRDAGAVKHLRLAVQGFEAAGMGAHAAVSRRCLGQLLGGDRGRKLRTRADTWMSEHGIVAPARLAAMLAPGCARD